MAHPESPPGLNSGRFYYKGKELRSDYKPGSGIHRREIIDRHGPSLSSIVLEQGFGFLQTVVLQGGNLQASASVSQAFGSNGGNAISHEICPPPHVADPVVPQEFVDTPARSEAPCVHQSELGAGSAMVDGGCQFVCGETICMSTSHCHCYHDYHDMEGLGQPCPWFWVTVRPLPQSLVPTSAATH